MIFNSDSRSPGSTRIRSLSAVMASLTLSLGVLSASSPVQAADYPSKPVRIVVPFAPGAATDILARLAANELSKATGQSFVVENVSGAGGTIGAAQVARAKPDGYTLMAGTPGPLTINPNLMKGLEYDAAADFQPIAIIAEGPAVMVVNSDSSFTSVQDIIKAAKEAPGTLTFGSSGVGSVSHLSGELLKAKTGIDSMHVPYRGSGPALMDLVAGRLSYEIEYFPAVQSLLQSNSVRALAVTSQERSPLAPDLPTMDEAGVPGYVMTAWVSLLAPKDTPEDIINTLHAALAESLKDPAIVEKLNAMGVVPGGLSPAEFSDYLNMQRNQIKELVMSSGISLEE